MIWGHLLETPPHVLDRALASFGVSLHRNAIFLVRDADEVIRNEATLLYQPCELGYAADDVAGGAARRVRAGRREKSYAFSCVHAFIFPSGLGSLSS